MTHIGQGGMVDDWWHRSTPNFEMGIGGGGVRPSFCSKAHNECSPALPTCPVYFLWIIRYCQLIRTRLSQQKAQGGGGKAWK